MAHLFRRAALFCVCAVLVLAAGLPAAARFTPQVDYAARGHDAIVTVNHRAAILFRVPNANLTPLERARITAERLQSLGGWKSITVKTVGKKRAQVVAGKRVICVATAADARAAKISAKALAATWAKNLRRLLSMPPITVTPTGIVVPERETRSVTVGGAAIGPVSTADSNPAVATSTFDPVRRVVIVRGKSVGRCTVEVSCQGCKAALAVSVKRYAGKLAGAGFAEVTGEPAPGRLLAKAAQRVATASVMLEPGATASLGRPRLPTSSIGKGESARVLVPIKIKGPNLIPTELLAPVDVFNRPVSYKPAEGLFYSNDPERITRYGTLFAGKLVLDEQTRLFFHHQNRLGRRVRLVVELINAGHVPATVQTISGIAPPMIDTVAVGYLAGLDFIRDYVRRIGLIHRIPPRSKLVVYADDLHQMMTASGIIDMRELSGGDVYVRVGADQPSGRQLAEGGIASISAARVPTRLSEHVYDAPIMRVDVRYVVGEQWQFIRIGKYSIRGTFSGAELYGNYGVIYEIRIHIDNPTGDNHSVQVMFEPTAGAAAGVFVVDGKIIGIRRATPPKEFPVTSVRVPAGQTRELFILTMPLGGSAYPATIVIR